MFELISEYIRGFTALGSTTKGFVLIVFMMLFLDGWKRIEFKRTLNKAIKSTKQ